MDTIGKGLGALGSLVHSGFLPSQEATTATTETKTTNVATSVIEVNSSDSVAGTEEQDSLVRNITVISSTQKPEEIEEIEEINTLLKNLGAAFKDFEKRVDENFGKMSSKLSDLEERVGALETSFADNDSDNEHSNVCRGCHSSSAIVPLTLTEEINTVQDYVIDSHHSHTPSGSSGKGESSIDP